MTLTELTPGLGESWPTVEPLAGSTSITPASTQRIDPPSRTSSGDVHWYSDTLAMNAVAFTGQGTGAMGLYGPASTELGCITDVTSGTLSHVGAPGDTHRRSGVGHGHGHRHPAHRLPGRVERRDGPRSLAVERPAGAAPPQGGRTDPLRAAGRRGRSKLTGGPCSIVRRRPGRLEGRHVPLTGAPRRPDVRASRGATMEPSPGGTRGRLAHLESILVPLGAVAAMFYAFRPLYSVDLFWHLQLGQVIWETGSIPTTDMFSAVHPESPWVQFQWLWELLAYGTVRLVGLTGLRALHALMTTAALVLAWVIFRRSAHGIGRGAGAGLAAATLLVLFQDRLQVRPDPVNLVLLVPALPFLLGGFREAGRGTWVALGALGLLWANLHSGGSALLLACVGALATGATLNRWLRLGPVAEGGAEPLARLWALTGALAVLLVASPASVEGIRLFATHLGTQLVVGNPEWDPAWKMIDNGLHPAFLIVAATPYLTGAATAWLLVARARRHGRAGVDAAEILLLGGLLFLSHHWVRTAWLAVVPLVVLLRAWEPPRWGRVALAAGAIAMLAVTWHYNVIRGRGSFGRAVKMAALDLEPTAYPEQAADMIETAGLEGPVMNEGKWGGYLIWRNWPAIRVFVDTRHNMTEEMWAAFVATHRPFARQQALDAVFARWGIDMAVFRAPTFPLYAAPAPWMLVYRSGDQEIHVRADTERGRENIRRAARYLEVVTREPIPDRDGDGLPDALPLSIAARRVGGMAWLDATYQEMRMTEALEDIASGEPVRRAAGRRTQAMLLWRAGLYEEALPSLRALVADRADDGRLLLATALAELQLGRPREARSTVAALLRTDPAALPRAERERARLLGELLQVTP